MPNNSDSSALDSSKPHGSFELCCVLITNIYSLRLRFFTLREFYGLHSWFCSDLILHSNLTAERHEKEEYTPIFILWAEASKARQRCALHFMNKLFTFPSDYLERFNLVDQVNSAMTSLRIYIGLFVRFVVICSHVMCVRFAASSLYRKNKRLRHFCLYPDTQQSRFRRVFFHD